MLFEAVGIFENRSSAMKMKCPMNLSLSWR
jgi:hypothetical protein